MIRITGGLARGRKLKVPGGPVRPTTDKVRQALFNVLRHSVDVSVRGARCLDLYAGAGSLGLEAASRGAQEVVLVEGDRKVARVLNENITALQRAFERSDEAPEITLVQSRVHPWLRGSPQAFDLIFADPPYDAGEAPDLLRLLQPGQWLSPEGVICLEHRAGAAPTPPAELAPVFNRRYGDCELSIYRSAP